jgi:hypothetical protein
MFFWNLGLHSVIIQKIVLLKISFCSAVSYRRMLLSTSAVQLSAWPILHWPLRVPYVFLQEQMPAQVLRTIHDEVCLTGSYSDPRCLQSFVYSYNHFSIASLLALGSPSFLCRWHLRFFFFLPFGESFRGVKLTIHLHRVRRSSLAELYFDTSIHLRAIMLT